MGTCVVRKGFLTLRDCGKPASANCATCQRPACPQHLAASTGFRQCLECVARSAKDQDAVLQDDDYGREWAYRYRRRYYGTGYMPIYTGDYDYDDYDVRSFDSKVNDAAVDQDDQSGPSFGDS